MQIPRKLTTSELLYNCAASLGMQPTWVADGLFSVITDDGVKHVMATKSNLNSHLSISLVRDKYITRTILKRHNVPNIPYTKPRTLQDAQVFLNRHRTIIAKPTQGSGAKDIHLIENPSELKDLEIKKYILEKYIAGKELRYLILDNAPIAVHESDYGDSVDEHRPLKRISYHMTTWDARLVTLSQQITDIFGLRFAAVDYIEEPNGNTHVLEVNSAPGLKWFHSPTSGPIVDVAHKLLTKMFNESTALPSIRP